jgi:antibiotic biosynthesis monooxygenase (ABM) superfamily enzyme
LYELLTVFLIAAVSAIVMVAWLKRRGKKKRQNGGG